jgi:hypothetical protein
LVPRLGQLGLEGLQAPLERPQPPLDLGVEGGQLSLRVEEIQLELGDALPARGQGRLQRIELAVPAAAGAFWRPAAYVSRTRVSVMALARAG